MSSSTTHCTVKLLDKIFDIKCPEEEEANLQAAAKKLNNQLLENKKSCQNLDLFDNVVLAALHLSRALVSCEKQQKHHCQVTELISSLEKKINKVVNGVALKEKIFELPLESDIS